MVLHYPCLQQHHEVHNNLVYAQGCARRSLTQRRRRRRRAPHQMADQGPGIIQLLSILSHVFFSLLFILYYTHDHPFLCSALHFSPLFRLWRDRLLGKEVQGRTQRILRMVSRVLLPLPSHQLQCWFKKCYNHGPRLWYAPSSLFLFLTPLSSATSPFPSIPLIVTLLLIIYTGNSPLGEDLYKDGFRNIHNIDFSPTVIEWLKETVKGREGLVCLFCISLLLRSSFSVSASLPCASASLRLCAPASLRPSSSLPLFLSSSPRIFHIYVPASLRPCVPASLRPCVPASLRPCVPASSCPSTFSSFSCLILYL